MYTPAQIMSIREVIIFLILTTDFWNYFSSKKNLSLPATNKYNFITHDCKIHEQYSCHFKKKYVEIIIGD